ncbi:hypothetical protein ACRAWG_06075 [Methylobacterium sp. P31]
MEPHNKLRLGLLLKGGDVLRQQHCAPVRDRNRQLRASGLYEVPNDFWLHHMIQGVYGGAKLRRDEP